MKLFLHYIILYVVCQPILSININVGRGDVAETHLLYNNNGVTAMDYLYEAIEPTRLYIKQCSHCDLKYFGKTKSKDIDSYPGSGIYWNAHLKKHSAEPIHLWNSDWYYDKSISRFAIKFSRINKIVQSDLWANLKEEDGLAGGFLLTMESHIKRIETRKKNGTLNTNTTESIQKAIQTKCNKGVLNVQTPEVIKKTLETKRKNGTLNVNTPESIQKGIETKRKNGTLGKNNISEESIRKQIETKRRNGTLKRSKESLEKQKQTVYSRDNRFHSAEAREKMKKPKEVVCCPNCGQQGGISQMKRWHFDNCKVTVDIQK